MNRKIVQINTVIYGEERNLQVTVALADDGTLWEGFVRSVPVYFGDKQTGEREHRFIWSEFPHLPQNTSNFTKVR